MLVFVVGFLFLYGITRIYLLVMLIVFNDGSMKDLCTMHGTIPVPYKGKCFVVLFF